MNDPWGKTGPWPQQQSQALGDFASAGFTKLPNPVDSDSVYPSAWDALSQDEVLALWEGLKTQLSEVKTKEMELRKYVVKRAFPAPTEGTNKVKLGGGYELKAGIKFDYKLIGTNEQIEECLDRIALIGNEGAFIGSRLVTWSADFHKTEYTSLLEASKAGSKFATEIVTEINKVLQIDDAAPTLAIVEPRKGKK